MDKAMLTTDQHPRVQAQKGSVSSLPELWDWLSVPSHPMTSVAVGKGIIPEVCFLLHVLGDPGLSDQSESPAPVAVLGVVACMLQAPGWPLELPTPTPGGGAAGTAERGPGRVG
jgi:hypothetical protein